MTHKTLFLAFLIAGSTVATTTHAQTPVAPNSTAQNAPMLTPEQRIEKRLAHARKTLGLTDSQVEQLRTILQNNASRLREERQSMRALPPGEQKKEARQQLMGDVKTLREQMKGVLTPDQLRKWKDMKADQIDRQEQRLERRKEELRK